MSVYATIDEWIAREAVPFSLESTDSFNSAVDRMIGSLGRPVDLLGLGEALHGGEDILAARNMLFRRLVEAHGYSAIAVESSYTRGHVVNEYVLGRGPSLYDDLVDSGFSHGFGRLEANRELVEWMRSYNKDGSHSVKLHFYGFDGPMEMMFADSPRQVLHFVLDYLASFDDDKACQARIDTLVGPDARWENPAAAMDPSQSVGMSSDAAALRLEVEDLLNGLRMRRPELVAKSGGERYQEALHYAEVARQLLDYHATLARDSSDRIERLLGMRDALMADNLVHMVSQEQGRGKVMAFAHNSHLRRGQAHMQLGPYALTWWPAGAQLAYIIGPRYAVIGSGVGVSEANGIGRPERGSLEDRLTAAQGPMRFIPTHGAQGPLARELATLPARSGSAKNPMYFPLDTSSIDEYDCLLILDSTGYSRGAPPLP